MGWRFVNAVLKGRYGVDTMPQTGENVATQFGISRADQDAFALRSQQRAAAAQADGYMREEIMPVPGTKRARLALTLVHSLERSGGRIGLAALCVGVGQGLALVVEGA
jgi:3-oxoadipyl-CoA thiolase